MTKHTRRTVLKAAGASAFVVTAAGCLGDDDDDNGSGNGNGDDDGDVDGFEIDGGTEIVFDGYSSHWEGVSPSEIDGEENPTLILEDGADYTIEWINADGIIHDLQIHDDDGNPVDDLISDEVDTEGESATLEFTADPEMVAYVCSYHIANQSGDIVVQ